MNIGGPAYHVALLSGRLDPTHYDTLLVHGRVGPGEASFEDLAREEGCRTEVVEPLGPEIRLVDDLRALAALVRIIRRFRPDIVHTHTAKAGFIGRLAAMLSRRPRPVIVHTYHGHVLEGYFGRLKTALYRGLEKCLARSSDALIGVSTATVDDLVRLRVASRSRFHVIPIGLDLGRFANLDDSAGARFRESAGAGADDTLLVYVGRLVPIKRVDLLIRAMVRLRESGLKVRLAIVGDGTERPTLEALTRDYELDDFVSFHGFVHDVAPVVAGTDIAVLSSANEGTPVALIEAGAARRPAVASRVGGVPDVVIADAGVVVAPGDDAALANEIEQLVKDPDLRRESGINAQKHVLDTFTIERLVRDVDGLYRALLLHRAGPAGSRDSFAGGSSDS